MSLEWAFWVSILVIVYGYGGYALFLLPFLNASLERPNRPSVYPSVTLLVFAYNEFLVLQDKTANLVQLDYPKDQLRIVFVTEGSTDGSADWLRKRGWEVIDGSERIGKSAALTRAMEDVHSDLVVLSDANSFFLPDYLKLIAKQFEDPSVGGVAGEKQIRFRDSGSVLKAEGLYWKFESKLKEIDAQFYSVIGAPGEAFSFRREAFAALPADTILDDFVLSTAIAANGKRVTYCSEAIAWEFSSLSVEDEMERRVRICAGAFQAIFRYWRWMFYFRNARFSFLYWSHRILRWTIIPILWFLLPPASLYLGLKIGGPFYKGVFGLYLLFWSMVLLGGFASQIRGASMAIAAPFHLTCMNLAALKGFCRFVSGRQQVIWKKAER